MDRNPDDWRHPSLYLGLIGITADRTPAPVIQTVQQPDLFALLSSTELAEALFLDQSGASLHSTKTTKYTRTFKVIYYKLVRTIKMVGDAAVHWKETGLQPAQRSISMVFVSLPTVSIPCVRKGRINTL